MSDIGAFPTMHDVLVCGDNIQDMTAAADKAIKAGQLVQIDADGRVNPAIEPFYRSGNEVAIGVALYDFGSGEHGAIAMDECIVKMANADDATDIVAGQLVGPNDNSVGGTISQLLLVSGPTQVGVGIAMETIPKNDVGKVKLGFNIVSTA
jgi:fumarate hydratase class II